MSESKENTQVTRKNSTRITLYLLPEEKAFIDENAKRFGMSSNEFIRSCVKGQKFPSHIDLLAMKELIKLRADLGRLGGLLKLWLSDDKKTQRFNVATIMQLLGRIDSSMSSLRHYIDALWAKLQD